jgi:hypothetical protein
MPKGEPFSLFTLAVSPRRGSALRIVELPGFFGIVQ